MMDCTPEDLARTLLISSSTLGPQVVTEVPGGIECILRHDEEAENIV